MLEEFDKIDIVTKSSDGKLQLVIADAGITVNPEERLQKLIMKLKTYMAYAVSQEFSEEHPGIDLNDIHILVMSKIPPTDEMLKIQQINSGNKTVGIVFQSFEGNSTETDLNNNVLAKVSSEKNDLKNWSELRNRLSRPASSNVPLDAYSKKPIYAAKPRQPKPLMKLLLSIFAIIIGPMLIFGSVRNWFREATLERNGLKTTAEIVNAKYEMATRGADRIRLELKYRTADSPNTSRTGVVYIDENNLHHIKNKQLQILYSKEDPSKIQIQGLRSPNWVLVALGSLFVFMGLRNMISWFSHQKL